MKIQFQSIYLQKKLLKFKKMRNYDTKIKLSFDNERTEFFVNEKKKIVTCIMKGLLNVTGRVLYVCNYKDYPFCNEFVKGIGVAKCDPRDVFDVELGKSIARARAEADAYLKAKRRLSEQYDMAVAYLKALTDFEEKAYRCAAHNDEFVDRLLYEHEMKSMDRIDCGKIDENDTSMCPPPEVDTTDDGITVQIKFKRK